MLTITIEENDKTIYEAEDDAIMDVLLAFAMYSRDEDFDRAIRRATRADAVDMQASKTMLDEMREVGAI